MNYSKLPICFVLMLLSSCVKEITSESIGVAGSTSIQSTSNLSFQVFSYNEFRPNFLHKSTMEDSIKGISSNGFTPLQQNVNNAFPIDAMVNLGRILFYDKNLSLNGQVSCGSCHIQSKAFTDGKSFSVGFNNHLTERSTMSIQNMDFINNYQWQSAVQGLPDLVTKPLLHPTEMGNNSIEEVVNRVKALNYYEPFHSKAFGHAEIQAKSLIWALSSFVGSIYSVNSKFDKQLNNFTDEENLGMTLFNGKAKCGECHTAPTFAAPDFAGALMDPARMPSHWLLLIKKAWRIMV
ncbi:MAG: cytochrome-c peroxidase [Saprospiraceae bacterium]|nr:cytochrome-c peroxidase [Saprospiraceae bacterium]